MHMFVQQCKRLLVASEEIDVTVIQRSAGKHHSMWVESCRRNRTGPVLL